MCMIAQLCNAPKEATMTVVINPIRRVLLTVAGYTLLYTWTGWVVLVFMRAGIHRDLDVTVVVGITGALVSATTAFVVAERASALRSGRCAVASTFDEITVPRRPTTSREPVTDHRLPDRDPSTRRPGL
jgi:hypothetical protein